MSNPPPTVLQLARQGDPEAIAALMNRHLESQGITAHVVQHDSTLQVNLEAAQIPNQADLVAYVKKGITGLELAAIQQLTVSGKQQGADASAWSEDLMLQDPPTDDLTFDLGLDTAPAADDLNLDEDFNLDFDLDSTAAALDISDLGDSDLGDSDLGDFDTALGNDFANGDLDLGFTDSPSDLDLNAPADFDLGFTNESSDDLSLDLADTSLTATDAAPEATDDFGLEFAEAAAEDLDFDLGSSAAPSESAAADLDFDLEFSDPGAEAAAFDAEFDLDLAEPAAGDNAEEAASTAATEFDFDLGLGNEPTSAAEDLDFDLDLIDEPGEGAPGGDFDLDLGMGDLVTGEETAEISMDALDLDLGSEAAFAAEADSDLEFDLAMEAAAAEELNNSLELDAPVADAGDRLDFDLDANSSDLDLDFAAADEAALGLETEAWPASSLEESEAFDLDLGADPELSEDFSPENLSTEGAIADLDAIAATDFDFDLATPAAPPTAPDIDTDLDDLWSSPDDSSTLDAPPAFDSAESAAPWAADLSAMDELADLDNSVDTDTAFTNEFADLDDFPGNVSDSTVELDALAAAEIDELETGFDLDLEAAEFDAAAPDLVEAASPDLGDLPPELLMPEAEAFEDLGAIADLDLTEPALGDDWPSASPELTLDADTDLGAYDELGTADFAAADFTTPDLDLAAGEFDTEALDSAPNDLELEAIPDDLALEPLGTDDFLAADSSADLSFAEDSSFDPGLVLDSAAEFETAANADFEGDFDPELTFDSPAEEPYTTPNPFEVDSFSTDFGTDFGADADLPFSTMELDQTVEGDYIPDIPLSSEFDGSDDAPLENPEDYGAGAVPTSVLDFGGEVDEDLAFESVEFVPDDAEAPGPSSADPVPQGFSSAGFGDAGFDDEGFDDEGFEDAGFDDAGFEAGGFSDGSLDSNGFMQDRNGAALVDEEPDATDDFIQEFGSDPSTHVSLTPDQFNDDGSVRRSGGSGLPMRLILGLGLGALVLALLAFLLNGLLGRLRQPAPGGEPVVTEPADPAEPPTDPAAVAEDDLFRQAVNAAQTAANQAQTASTSAQWQEVADAWARAIDLMQRVPAADPNYAVAQQKAVEYQPNLNYAQQNAEQLQ
ncbi:hypothetical protein PGN35_014975 [Nodosilinea sp. PGN35]|uniref:hypothetical protein n=1 Tax=Nodosilinea sp. PGN35 TaxID=3020489 RepID=UPI0023B33DA9|nr:hypothetical protein [Nodosilinea sp. TSF1-S3]MDF0369923.1 hypothetical protein [Nodosilinea sp. TSF1-S3]